MKLICLQENLKDGINIAERIVGKNLNLPILSNLLLSAEKGKLKISATDLEIGINTQVPAKVVSEGSLTVPAKLLSSFINNLPPGKQVELESSKDLLNIKCENFKASINGLDAKDFPLIPAIKGDKAVKIKANIFKNSLIRTVFSAALKETRPEICGIFLKFDSDSFKIAATDSFRLAEKIISKEDFKSEKSGGLIVPLKTVQELIRIIGEKTEELKLIFETNQILFDLDETQLFSRLIEGEYPRYEQIIPKDFETQLILKKGDFLNAVKLAGIFCGKANDIKFIISPKGKTLEIQSSQSETGSNKSILSASKAQGNEVSAVFNYKYVLDGLANIYEDEVVLELNGETRPGLLKGIEEKGYLYIFMPIKNQ